MAFAESCYSAARQEAFAHRIVFVEIKQRFLDGLFLDGMTWWPDLVPFGSLVYIEMFVGRGNGNGRIVPFLLSRLDHPTSIQDGGRREKKEEKRKGRRKRINFQIDSEIDSPGENRFEISKLKHRGKEGKLRTCWLARPSNNTRGQVIHRLTRWLLQGGV